MANPQGFTVATMPAVNAAASGASITGSTGLVDEGLEVVLGVEGPARAPATRSPSAFRSTVVGIEVPSAS